MSGRRLLVCVFGCVVCLALAGGGLLAGEASASAGGVSGSEALAIEEARAPKAGAAGGGGEASGEPVGSSTEAATGSSSPSGWSLSLSGDPLLIGGALTEAELLQAQEEVRLASPEAVLAREESQSAYSGLGRDASEELAGRSFPNLVRRPDGGPPSLPEGQRIVGFSSEFSATLALPDGKHGAIVSMSPVATDTPSGRVPVDLTPQQAGSGFEATTPAAGMHVRVGGRLSEGASLPDVGVTLTPVTEGGAPLEAGGVIDAQAVFYGDSENAQADVRDVDSLVKLGTYQFSEETILRSKFSPSKLYFRVGLPEGASLVQEGSGPALVVDAGRVLATIMVPGAHDAEGTAVRGVSMSVAGDTIVVSVPHQPDEYRLPLAVDPTVSEGQSMGRYQLGRNWWFYASGPGNAFTNYEPKYGVYGMEDHDPYSAAYKAEEYGLFGYEAQGESRIYEFTSESYDNNPSTISSTVYIGGPGRSGQGEAESPVRNAEWTPTTVCAVEGCPAAIGEKQNWANGAFYKQAALAEGGNFEDLLRSATVYIVQEKGPSVTSGACGSVWAKVGSCNVELSATDPGLGISEYVLSSPNAVEWGTKNKTCTMGLPCGRHVVSQVKLTGLPEGEDTIKATAQDAVGLSAASERTVKVDNAAPHSITLSGLPASKEIGAGEYKLKAEAMDGEGATRSSGIMWIALLIDGREVGSRSGSCTLGPCSAHGEWTIFGRDYGTGHHTITVLVADNAGNTASEQITMIVHPASPLALGPGAVNPQSGEFSLQATDVSMGGGLSVSRSYTSRHLSAGAEGPLASQWGFALGGEETLVKQTDGSMVLTDASGAQTNFASDGKGGFISPPGDSNLTLSSAPCKPGQTEYMLRNAAASTTTCFAVPSGGSGEVMTPSIAEGPVATDTVTYSYRTAKANEYSLAENSWPVGITSGPDGNLWFTEYSTNKIGKITTAGEITEYALPKTGYNNWPEGITTGPDGNLWYTAIGTNAIGKITTSGAATEYALPAESWPYRITTGPDGNLWFTEGGTHKIGKITTSGAITEYALPTGASPHGITEGPDGNIWFTNAKKIGKITTTGAITEYPINVSASEITSGPDGNLWFTSAEAIGKITTAGAVTEYPVPAARGIHGIVRGTDGNLWFAASGTDNVGKITTSGVVTEYSTGGVAPSAITSGPGGNLWYTGGSSEIGVMTTLGPITEPTEALAPVPAGVSCSPELKPGCRALRFNYASSTTATGESSSEWGDVSGHLTRVYYTAYDSASKAMKTVEVAHYLYDKQARLRTEWDPRVSPALETTYGYDAEGHLTALTPPGQESWAITYGTIAGDAGGGRVLKVTRAPAWAPLWAGAEPQNTAVPAISGSAVLGVRMAVSDGSWSESPVAYAYQWEDCNSLGGECKAIPGATNANYTPTGADVGYRLIAQVSATNGGGSTVASSALSAPVASSAPAVYPSYSQSVDAGNSLNAVSCVPNTTDCVVSDSLGKAFYATNVSATSGASWSSWSGPGTSPSEAVACPTVSLCLLAAGSKEGYGGNLYYATSLGGAWTLGYSPTYGVDAISCSSSSFCLDGQDNWGYFRYATSPASASWNLEGQGNAAMKGVSCISSSFCAIVDGAGSVHVATSTSQIQSSSWTETNVDGTAALNGIACTSTSSCVAVDGAGNVLNLSIAANGAATASKDDIDGTNDLTAVACSGSMCVTVDAQGNVLVSSDRGESWSRLYALGGKLTSVSCSSAVLCVTVDASGNVTSFEPSLTQAVDSGASLSSVSCIPGTSECVAADSKGGAFYATNAKVNAPGSWSPWGGPGVSPSEALACPASSLCVLDDGEKSGGGGNIYYAESLGGPWYTGIAQTYGGISLSCPSALFCASGATGAWDYWSYLPGSWGMMHQQPYVVGNNMTAIACLSSSFCAMGSSEGEVYVADTKALVESGEWARTDVNGSRALNGIACTSTSSCVAVDSAGNVLNLSIAANGSATVSKHDIDGTNSLTAVVCSGSTCITVDNHGIVFVSSDSGSTWSEQYALRDDLTSVSCASSTLCAAADTTGGISVFNPAAGILHEGEALPPQPGSAVEYGVPLSGAALPTMTSGEVERWAQKDLPTEATAIFPPDEPQGWPASGYKRATIYYRDSTSRTVNVESPGGAISTSEYNEQNDVTRSLSADNRAAALKEANPTQTAKLLDTQSAYNSEGTELLSTLGPQHLVKLANGKEVQARSHTVYSYDEGAPSEGGPYRLVTKVTQGAQIEGEAEQDVRATIDSYAGQKGLGWKLRTPTSVTQDPNGLSLTKTTVFDEATGAAIETRGPRASIPATFSFKVKSWTTNSTEWFKPYGVATDGAGNVWVVESAHDQIQQFSSTTGKSLLKTGSEGAGNDQFKEPQGIAIDKEGDVWLTDTANNRVEELSSTGAFIRAFGTSGTGNGQFKKPQGIAIDASGHVWVGDTGNNRVQEFNLTGEYIRQLGSEGGGNGQFKTWLLGELGMWIATDPEGNVWVADSGNNRVQEFSSEGAYITQFGTKGTGNGQLSNPQGIGVDTQGNVWVVDQGNNRIEEFSHAGAYITQFGTQGVSNGQFKAPKDLTADSSGHIWVTDTENYRVQQFTGAGQYVSQITCEGLVAESAPGGAPVAVDIKGNVWTVDSSHNRVEKFNESGEFVFQFGSSGTGNGQFEAPGWIASDAKGNIWVADTNKNRIEKFTENGEYLLQFGSAGTGNGQFKGPGGIAVDARGNVWVVDAGDNRVEKFNEKGEYLLQLGAEGAGNGQFKKPKGIGASGSSVWVTDTGNNRVQQFGEKGEYISQFGSEGKGYGQFKAPQGIAIDSKSIIWVVDESNLRIQQFGEDGSYIAQFAINNKIPTGIGLDSKGNAWISTTLSGGLEKWIHNMGIPMKTIYYTAAANASYPVCGEHPEWANLPCQTLPSVQPGTPGIPNLPVTTTGSYNMFDEPLSTTSTVTECVKVSPGTGKYTDGSCAVPGAGEYESKTSTRTSTLTYDEAGRTLSSETSSTVGAALPAVTDKYAETTGAPIEQSTTSGGVTQTIKSAYNTLGQLVAYTDAGGNTTTYEYEGEGDGRLLHVDDGKGTQTYTYDATTGALSKLVDNQGVNQLTFTAVYDIEGNMTSESYPNGMNANYTRNPAGDTTGLSYVKTTDCTENCTWFSDAVVPSIHGQWLSQQSTLSTESYTYDQAGRLLQTQETPLGEGCTTRVYGYDEETNRMSLTTRPAGAGGVCASEGGSVEGHTYDVANRLTDQGVAYEPFGETSRLPGSDAGGSELHSTFYADGQLHEQSQNGQSIGYALDPAGRPQETIDTGTVDSTYVSHYVGAGGSPSWTVEPTSGHWTRYVPGIGGFAAIETDTEAPVLQLQDLQGNVVATASCSETATKLLSTERPTEYGVPTSTKPAKYGWLGANMNPTELSSGVVAMGARSYVPQLGRYLQTDPVEGGSANAYAYVFGDPVNSQDPSGEDANGPSEWAIGLADELTGQEVAAYEQAKREEAERKAAEAAAAAAAYAALEAATALPTEGGVEEVEEVEEGGSGGTPVAVAATRANTPGARFAEARCDDERNRMEKLGYKIGDFTGKYQTEPGTRYKGTSYELLYETTPIFLPFGAHSASLGEESTCHVIINRSHGHYHVTQKAHFRLKQGLRRQEV